MSKNIIISKIKVNGGGSKGLAVTYSQVDFDGISYNNSYDLTSPKPVSSDFRECLRNMIPFARKFFRLDETVQDLDITITEIDIKANGCVIKAKVGTAVTSAHTNKLTSCLITDDTFSEFDDLVEAVDALRKETQKYTLGKTKEDSHQFLRELTANKKTGDLATAMAEIEGLSEEDAHKRMIEELSKKGAIFLDEGSVTAALETVN